MRSTQDGAAQTRSTPINNTVLQIVLLLAAFGTSGSMFAATLV